MTPTVNFDIDGSQWTEVEKLYSTQEELTSLWYTPADFKRFKRDNNNNNNHRESSSSASVVRERQECCRSLVYGLLSQQKEQRQMGIHDTKGLRMFSKACSKKATQRAYQKALVLAKEVMAMEEEADDAVSKATTTTTPTTKLYQTRRLSFHAVCA